MKECLSVVRYWTIRHTRTRVQELDSVCSSCFFPARTSGAANFVLQAGCLFNTWPACIRPYKALSALLSHSVGKASRASWQVHRSPFLAPPRPSSSRTRDMHKRLTSKKSDTLVRYDVMAFFSCRCASERARSVSQGSSLA